MLEARQAFLAELLGENRRENQRWSAKGRPKRREIIDRNGCKDRLMTLDFADLRWKILCSFCLIMKKKQISQDSHRKKYVYLKKHNLFTWELQGKMMENG